MVWQRKQVLVLVPVCLALLAGGANRSNGQAPAKSDQEITATAEVAEQQYCENYPDAVTVFMKLRVRFANHSHKSIILAKSLEPPSRVRASSSWENARRGVFEYEPNVFKVSSTPPVPSRLGEKPDPNRFVTLNPGDAYETIIWSGLIVDPRKPEVPGGIGTGQHVMQVFVDTWPYDDVEPEKLAAKWQARGQLVFGQILTNLFPFSIPVRLKAPSCQHFTLPEAYRAR